MYQTLISVDALQRHYSPQGWVVFDCRFDLADVKKGHRLYREGHIPAAQFMDLEQDLSSAVTALSGRHPLPDFEVLKEKLGKAGVTSASQVVVYDDCGGAMAARLWWLMRYLGHTSIAVLDGGYPAWVQHEGETSANVFSPAQTVYQGNLSTTDAGMPLVSSAELQQQLPDVQLVDARATPRFNGEVEPIDPVAGHIPGALNRPFQDNLTTTGVFKPADELANEWSALVNAHEPVIHMCGSGVTACHNILAMTHAGLNVLGLQNKALNNSVLYAGSWSEWIRDNTRPVECL
ncbi:sulfurtransferase [Neptunomonas antarctica]|uniref:Thiosulfate/3-mercaptopyruvate sulfurtransferase n=1 Tax=Neptunomonas antarctica TaxID=619304 RepID=A0A1N7NLJ1_9GAMM|nr:sulfurtransferase [Neptunomonas antarctica]SIS99263.1 thiosulfate/3-mercaptopyruvate sulfurtransferase [Neptunomonas antarctica]